MNGVAFHTNLSRATRLVRSATVQTALVTYTGIGLSLLSAPVLARTLGSDGRGVLAGVFASLQVLAWIAFFGIPRGAVVAQVGRAKLASGALILLTLLGAVAALGLFLAAPLLAGGSVPIENGIRMTSWILLFAGTAQLGSEHLHAQSKFLVWNLHRSVTLTLPSLLIIGLFFTERLTLQSAVFATALGQVCWAIIGTFVALFAVNFRTIATGLDFKFCLGYWFATLFSSVGARIDQVFLAAAAETSQLGVYAVAMTCASASGALTQAIGHVAFPRLLKSTSAGRATLYRRSTKLGVLASFVSGTSIVLLLWLLEKPLLGPTYEGVVAVTAILVFYQALLDQWQLFVYRETAGGLSKEVSTISAIALLVLVVSLLGIVAADVTSNISVSLAMVFFAVVRLLAAHLRSKGV